MRKIRKKRGIVGGVWIAVIILLFAILAKNFFAEEKLSITASESNEYDTNAAYNITESQSISITEASAPMEILDNSSKADVLILVNKNHKLPDDYKANLTKIENVKVNEMLLDDLKEMRTAVKKEKYYLYIATAHRTKAEQEQIFNNIAAGFVKNGNSQNVAAEKAKQAAALPGYSEHETGLAIDFSLNGNADKQAEMWDWLSKNAYKYGFILRYPEGKENITGYNYEPWHYRYVGKQHARTIYEQSLVLEEYLNILNQ